jgi:hypothetical protein
MKRNSKKNKKLKKRSPAFIRSKQGAPAKDKPVHAPEIRRLARKSGIVEE